MRKLFKHRQHLVRMAGLFVLGILAFVALQAMLVPEGFGVYGHYRAGAIADNRKRPPVFAGRAACVACHAEAGQAIAGGGHARVGCEACHGALNSHVAAPAQHKPVKPDPLTLCPVCHESNVARPELFPQVDPKTHMDGGPCGDCHVPHAPGME